MAGALPEIDDMLGELREFRTRFATWTEHAAAEESSGGRADAVLATCVGSGAVTALQIAPDYLRSNRPATVERAILAALRDAQSTAASRRADRLSSLEFLGLPIGATLSGTRDVEDLRTDLMAMFAPDRGDSR